MIGYIIRLYDMTGYIIGVGEVRFYIQYFGQMGSLNIKAL